ncbi:ceramide synthase 1 [Onychostruthus taczanowskii]|uniref:ceramide synthase 1 n=1 Tax=Onychostruthus taczanowskii TaxID=356909 RepID=UPI001B804957|nr:ceramide synthase 1 [Onychostruthus taczanowskii]
MPPPPEPMPGYGELLRRGYGSLAAAARSCGDCGWELALRTWAENAHLGWAEVLLCGLCALGWTALRRACSRRLFRPFGEWCKLQPRDAAKMPESAWKLLFYSLSWSYGAYLLFCTDYPFFHDPPSVFYDSNPAMLLHHLVTLTLLASSYAFRYHNVGVLVLFLHDVNDVQLEFTKLNVYFKHRGGVYHRLNDVVSNIGCLAFSVSWFWFRLYWFPLKVLYATCHSSLQSVPNIPFYFFFNALLLVLTLMNIYWFLYIVLFVAKVLLGQMQEVNDVREYDVEESRKPGKEAGIQLPQALKEGLHLKNGLVKDKRL